MQSTGKTAFSSTMLNNCRCVHEIDCRHHKHTRLVGRLARVASSAALLVRIVMWRLERVLSAHVVVAGVASTIVDDDREKRTTPTTDDDNNNERATRA